MSVLSVLCVFYYGPSEINDDADNNDERNKHFGRISFGRHSVEIEPRSTIWERIMLSQIRSTYQKQNNACFWLLRLFTTESIFKFSKL